MAQERISGAKAGALDQAARPPADDDAHGRSPAALPPEPAPEPVTEPEPVTQPDPKRKADPLLESELDRPADPPTDATSKRPHNGNRSTRAARTTPTDGIPAVAPRAPKAAPSHPTNSAAPAPAEAADGAGAPATGPVNDPAPGIVTAGGTDPADSGATAQSSEAAPLPPSFTEVAPRPATPSVRRGKAAPPDSEPPGPAAGIPAAAAEAPAPATPDREPPAHRRPSTTASTPSRSARDLADGPPATGRPHGARPATERRTGDRRASDRTAMDRGTLDRAAANRAAIDRDAADRVAAERAAAGQAATGQTATDHPDPDQADSRQTASGRAATGPAAPKQSATDRAATDRASTDRASTDQPATDQPATDRAATDRAATDRAATDRAATDQLGAATAVRRPATGDATADQAVSGLATAEPTADQAVAQQTSAAQPDADGPAGTERQGDLAGIGATGDGPKSAAEPVRDPEGQAGPAGSPAGPGEVAATAAQGGPAVKAASGAATVGPDRPDPAVPPSTTADQAPEQVRPRPLAPGEGLPTSSRVLSRIARLGSGRGSSTSPLLEPLLRTLRASHPKADLSQVERAFEVAARAHAGQKRRSGDPYITHPVAVSSILAELGMTPPTLAAALLHDTVEDTEYTLEQLRTDFGDEIAMLVDGVTKLDKVKYGDATQAETVRKMVVAMSRDIRVLVIKLADRLHNARTWRYVPQSSAERKARETLEIYAPLAHRLGMNTIKWELEDLSFATLYPKVYDEIVRLVAERAPAREDYLAQVREQVTADLRAAKIKAAVTGRPKHYYSVYQKMIVRGRDFTDIYDLVGVRVLVETVRDCYAVLGALHARWNPVPGRFKDYIAMPKFNMYQSLHTTVIGPEGKPVEIQIRTHQMHRRAEYGVAAHWKYKDDPAREAAKKDERGVDMAWLRQLLDWQRETVDPGEFLDSLRFEINAQEVYVFTPKGDVMALPSDSTPVDFAYAVHTEVGHRCMGARVNGRLVPLESKLDNGDVVEIFTSKADAAGPSRDWLTVRPQRAGPEQDPAVVLQGAPRGGDRARQGRDREGDAQAAPADAAAAVARVAGRPGPRDALPRRLRRSTRPSARATSRRRTSCSGSCSPLGGEAGAEEDLAEATSPTRPAPAAAGATPGSWSGARTTCGSSSPAAARRCRGTRSSGSSPAAAGSRCTAATAATSPGC